MYFRVDGQKIFLNTQFVKLKVRFNFINFFVADSSFLNNILASFVWTFKIILEYHNEICF